MYGTAFMPRHAVVPGTMIKHKGKYWRSSANLEKGLYALPPLGSNQNKQ
ncbi:hypothetical protein [Erwinia pyrifoliae]|nr:hypothetical protein [Erwinia pyrifoliae]